MKYERPYWWLKFKISGCDIPVGTRLASSFVTCFVLQFEVIFCWHEQCMKMTQIPQLYLKESLTTMETLGRLSYCIAPLACLRRFWKNSVRIVCWSLELFNVLHQVHPHWHRGQIHACRSPSFWRCTRLQWLPEIGMASNLGVCKY